jgi:hypothetical protein
MQASDEDAEQTVGRAATRRPGSVLHQPPWWTKMVHGRARAPSRQTLRVAANEVRSRVPPADGGRLVLFFETEIS